MEGQSQNAVPSCCPSRIDGSPSAPDLLPPENHRHDDGGGGLTHHNPRLGTVIPNRIFVGGIDDEVNESDLQHVFSQRGVVKEVKIVIDRSGASKGYGFVTFETQDDVLKILHDANGISFKDKKLSIGQAVRKQHASGQTKSAPVSGPDPLALLPASCGTLYLTTSAGYPYIYHNGVAYFCRPNKSPAAHPLPPVTLPPYHQPVYQRYQWGDPNQHQRNVVQLPMCVVVHLQRSECPYRSAAVQPNAPVTEDAPPETMEPTVYPLYPRGTEGMRLVVLQHDPRENRMFPHPQVHLEPLYHRYVHYPPEATQPADASALSISQPPT